MIGGRVVMVALVCVGLWALPAAAQERVAFFGIKLIDMSLGRTTPEELARLDAMQTRLVEALTESGRYTFVDTAPIAEKADLYENLAHCNGCDSRFARDLGADIALSGEVQKTSDLILSISIYMRDAETGALIGGGSADMRGNNDQSWARGINYIIKNRILR